MKTTLAVTVLVDVTHDGPEELATAVKSLRLDPPAVWAAGAGYAFQGRTRAKSIEVVVRQQPSPERKRRGKT